MLQISEEAVPSGASFLLLPWKTLQHLWGSGIIKVSEGLRGDAGIELLLIQAVSSSSSGGQGYFRSTVFIGSNYTCRNTEVCAQVELNQRHISWMWFTSMTTVNYHALLSRLVFIWTRVCVRLPYQKLAPEVLDQKNLQFYGTLLFPLKDRCAHPH